MTKQFYFVCLSKVLDVIWKKNWLKTSFMLNMRICRGNINFLMSYFKTVSLDENENYETTSDVNLYKEHKEFQWARDIHLGSHIRPLSYIVLYTKTYFDQRNKKIFLLYNIIETTAYNLFVYFQLKQMNTKIKTRVYLIAVFIVYIR